MKIFPDWLRRRRSKARSSLFSCLLLCLSITAHGQMNTGEITGILTDPTGAFINGASVTAIHVATQQEHKATTSGEGQYLFPQLPLGDYELSVNAHGFERVIQRVIVLHVGDHVRRDFLLALGSDSQSVEVESAPALMQVESAELKDAIENQRVVGLPLKGRQFLELTFSAPTL